MVLLWNEILQCRFLFAVVRSRTARKKKQKGKAATRPLARVCLGSLKAGWDAADVLDEVKSKIWLNIEERGKQGGKRRCGSQQRPPTPVKFTRTAVPVATSGIEEAQRHWRTERSSVVNIYNICTEGVSERTQYRRVGGISGGFFFPFQIIIWASVIDFSRSAPAVELVIWNTDWVKTLLSHLQFYAHSVWSMSHWTLTVTRRDN